MKILISDFDGTLFIDGKISYENVKKIEDFRSKGNIFIISTARNFETVKKECLNYKVVVDFFFCDIGSVILDNEGNVIYRQYINLEERKNIEEVLEKYEDLILVKRYGVNSIQKKEIKNVVEYKIKGEITIIEKKKSILDGKIKKAKMQITEDAKLIIHMNTKEKIIETFVRMKKLEGFKIITLGDELDDLNMLKLYNGYRMENSNEKVKKIIKKSVKSVAELIDLEDLILKSPKVLRKNQKS